MNAIEIGWMVVAAIATTFYLLERRHYNKLMQLTKEAIANVEDGEKKIRELKVDLALANVILDDAHGLVCNVDGGSPNGQSPEWRESFQRYCRKHVAFKELVYRKYDAFRDSVYRKTA